MIGNPSHSGARPTAYTQLGTFIPGPQVNDSTSQVDSAQVGISEHLVIVELSSEEFKESILCEIYNPSNPPGFFSQEEPDGI